MKRNLTHKVALGGVTAALALVIMGLGGLIPAATYICPMLLCIILDIIRTLCGTRIGWAWFFAVSILSLMISPDKEAAFVFLFIGYYPIVKPQIEKLPVSWLLKFLVFNLSIGLCYGLLLWIMGAEDLGLGDFQAGMGIMLLVMGNLTFFLLDKLLALVEIRMKHSGKRK